MQRHVKIPKVNDRIATSRYGTVRVEEVEREGLVLSVRDRIGRRHRIERSRTGVWRRVLAGEDE